jgi:hypothetical protein
MSEKHVDYDRVAPSYNQRFAANRLEAIANALLLAAKDVAAERGLEVGCGTGVRRIKAALAEAEADGEPLTFTTDLPLAILAGRTSERDDTL